MKIKNFEDIISWKKSKELSISIYNKFNKIRDFSFKDQIQRASISIMNNIAEEYERGSNRDFVKFLYIARGSCGEVRSMLYIAVELQYVSNKEFRELYSLCIEISRLIYGLIGKLKENQES